MMTLKVLKKLIEEIESKVGVPADRIQVMLEPCAEPYVVAGAFIKMDEYGNCSDMQEGVYVCVSQWQTMGCHHFPRQNRGVPHF